MPRPDLSQLQTQLLRSGVAPRHVHRTVVELDAHFDDLVDEALDSGTDLAQAEQQAIRQLGDIDLPAALPDISGSLELLQGLGSEAPAS